MGAHYSASLNKNQVKRLITFVWDVVLCRWQTVAREKNQKRINKNFTFNELHFVCQLNNSNMFIMHLEFSDLILSFNKAQVVEFPRFPDMRQSVICEKDINIIRRNSQKHFSFEVRLAACISDSNIKFVSGNLWI